jgi:RNA polymerase sigma-70 factor, ECF subfamily
VDNYRAMACADDRRVAFERLFASTYGPVRAYVLRRAPAEISEDVLSEVYLVAWRRFDSLGDDPVPWLYGVARRVLANQFRGDRRRRALGERLRSADRLQSPWPAPDGLRAELAAAVAALPEAEREALLLVAWEGLSPARAAEAAGCSATAFRVRLHRARRRLAAALNDSTPRPSSSIPEGAP